eukprot:4613388-Pleurochrysis_carterae.AAC.1
MRRESQDKVGVVGRCVSSCANAVRKASMPPAAGGTAVGVRPSSGALKPPPRSASPRSTASTSSCRYRSRCEAGSRCARGTHGASSNA